MLTHLLINNFALVDQLELELKNGMTVISGETGAGKSIMLDALGLTLGDRADSDTVREGEERAEITATFDISEIPEAIEWLSQHDLDQDNECQIRRIVTREGRSRSYINGQPAPLNQLKELGQFLVDIHGQHEHQRLLHREYHRILLDDFAQQRPVAEKVRQQFQRWQKLEQTLKKLTEDSAEKTARTQLLSYQLEELNQLALQEDELEALEQEQKLLENAGQLLQSGHQIMQIISEHDEQNCISLLNQSQQLLQQVSRHAPALSQVAEMLNNAQILVDEASHELRSYLDNVELSPERLNEVEERLTLIYDVARKHRVQPDQLMELRNTLQLEMDSLHQSDEALDQLHQDVTNARQEYLTLAKKLSQSRQTHATKLAKAVDIQLHSLGMTDARFSAQLTPLDDSKWNANGLEEVEFLIAANRGQTARPLAKVASGGELSRISLAIQVITAQTSSTPTLVFDEVDVGIGGAIAEVVGRLLRELGERTQILCVTHQPQVASQGHQHLFVSKRSQKNKTQTQIDHLDQNARLQEVARMLGGIQLTDATLMHAKEMLKH
ncbi:DNA repair protein RecN [Nitrincola schmidtii]|uniref:DNA repair protein RecN n=1 Tax=Nitrincola schmidtii TaxID=1730894 RepID=UPI00124C58C7|nr:DNA repair protein RecN [Nitrincola schmidtii]